MDSFERPRTMSTLDLNDLRLNLEKSDLGSPLSATWSRMPTQKRVALGASFLLALFIAGVFLRSTFASKSTPPTASVTTVEAVGPSLISNGNDWSTDWNGAGSQGRQISILRPSLTLADYRMQFQGEIQNKSIGWIYRAANPKNYYASRLQITKSGLNPTVVIAHYAVINGEETQRTETPLPMPVHLDTVYKVRTDVFGSQFKIYLKDTLIDSWSDDRLKTGGFGLLSEPGDRAQLRLVQLFELRAGK